jgi:uncharacterized membrane protein YfbV (UPF0208 family)
MSERRPNSYLMRAVLANAFILLGLYQMQKAGKLTPAIIGVYVAIAIAVNGLMYLGARLRRRQQNR